MAKKEIHEMDKTELIAENKRIWDRWYKAWKKFSRDLRKSGIYFKKSEFVKFNKVIELMNIKDEITPDNLVPMLSKLHAENRYPHDVFNELFNSVRDIDKFTGGECKYLLVYYGQIQDGCVALDDITDVKGKIAAIVIDDNDRKTLRVYKRIKGAEFGKKIANEIKYDVKVTLTEIWA